MKTVCIDARLYGIAHTGIGRYTQNLILNLPSDPNIQVVLIVSPENINNPELKSFPKYQAIYHPYHPLAQIEMPWLLAKIQPDLYHATDFTAPIFWFGKTIITIHDLIKIYFRGSHTTTKNPVLYWLKYFWYRFNIWLDVHKAWHLIVPSKYWQDQLIHRYHLAPEKVSVTYEGIPAVYLHPAPADTLVSFPKPYLVHTGNLYPHKNIDVVIKALDKLQGKVGLVLIGARDVFSARIPHRDYITYLGRLTDTEVIDCYRQATAYVYPSLMEGFGLQGLEAMAVGTPVIAAQASCLPEIYADAALYFNPYDPADLVKTITKLETNSQSRKNLIQAGFARIKMFSWSKMSRQTWTIYQKMLP